MRKKIKFKTFLMLPFAMALLTACGKTVSSSGVSVTSQLRRVANATLPSINSKLFSPLVENANWTNVVEIESYKVPISSISLATDSDANAAVLYSCSGTASDCLIDLAAGDVQDNLFAAAANSTRGSYTNSVTPGTYKAVTTSFCTSDLAAGSSTFVMKVKAKAIHGSVTYYTKTGSQYMTSTEADYGETDIEFSNGCFVTTLLNSPLTLEASAATDPTVTVETDSQTAVGASIDFNVFFDLRHSLVFQAAASTINYSDKKCTVPYPSNPNGSAPYLCGFFPYLSGTVSKETPTLQRYLMRFEKNGDPGNYEDGLVGLFIDPTTHIAVGGYGYPYYGGDADSAGAAQGFTYGVKKILTTSAGDSFTYDIHVGSGNTNQSYTADGYVIAPGFSLLGSAGLSSTVSGTVYDTPTDILMKRLDD